MIKKFALFVLLMGLALPALAQDDAFTLTNTTPHTLDADAIHDAAQPLIEQGARVAVYLIAEHGGEADFLARLRADGCGNGSYADEDVLAVYVSLAPRYSEIRWGEDYDRALSSSSIRADVLNPRLRDAEFSYGFEDTLIAIQRAVGIPAEPADVVGSVPEPAEVTDTALESAEVTDTAPNESVKVADAAGEPADGIAPPADDNPFNWFMLLIPIGLWGSIFYVAIRHGKPSSGNRDDWDASDGDGWGSSDDGDSDSGGDGGSDGGDW